MPTTIICDTDRLNGRFRPQGVYRDTLPTNVQLSLFRSSPIGSLLAASACAAAVLAAAAAAAPGSVAAASASAGAGAAQGSTETDLAS